MALGRSGDGCGGKRGDDAAGVVPVRYCVVVERGGGACRGAVERRGVWILFPVPFLQPLAAWVTGTAAGGLEALVTACAESGSLAFEAAAGGVATAAAYTAMAIFTLWLWSLGRR